MGVQARVVVFSPDESGARAAASAAFARIAHLEEVMSDYRDQSELSRLCSAAGAGPAPVSDDLFRVLSASVEWSRRTEGAFDVTAGPLSRLWRESRRSGALPTDEQLAAARALTGWRMLTLDAAARTATLELPGMQLDLGGIGKGFAVREASDLLRRLGFPRHLVALSGDISVGDAPPGERGWRIAVENGANPAQTLEIANRAVSTSGSAAQFVEIAGVRYSHVIDPRTGLGLTTQSTTTVVSRDGAVSDAMSTSLAILGPAAAGRLTRRFKHAEALIAEGGREVWRSGGWGRMVSP